MDDLTEKLKKMKVPHESIEQGSEFATPRDYRALGRNTAIDEIILMLKKTETAPHEKRIWFFNSRGEIQQTAHYHSEKHQKRVMWGNAFSSREEAKAAKEQMQQVLFFRPQIK